MFTGSCVFFIPKPMRFPCVIFLSHFLLILSLCLLVSLEMDREGGAKQNVQEGHTLSASFSILSNTLIFCLSARSHELFFVGTLYIEHVVQMFGFVHL